MSYFLYYNEKGYYDGWGTFDCSVCSKSVFIQYDSYEKPSTGRIITHKGRCYCLCDRCVNKCITKGKAKVLKNAKDYKPTDDTYNEPEYLKDVPTEYKSLAGLIPAIVLIAAIGMELKRILKLPEDQRKKAKKKLKERLKKNE